MAQPRLWPVTWRLLVVLALAPLFGWIWWKVPLALFRNSGGGEDAKLKAITDTRTALLAGLVRVGALLTFWLNSRVYRITAAWRLWRSVTVRYRCPAESNSLRRRTALS